MAPWWALRSAAWRARTDYGKPSPPPRRSTRLPSGAVRSKSRNLRISSRETPGLVPSSGRNENNGRRVSSRTEPPTALERTAMLHAWHAAKKPVDFWTVLAQRRGSGAGEAPVGLRRVLESVGGDGEGWAWGSVQGVRGWRTAVGGRGVWTDDRNRVSARHHPSRWRSLAPEKFSEHGFDSLSIEPVGCDTAALIVTLPTDGVASICRQAYSPTFRVSPKKQGASSWQTYDQGPIRQH